MMYSLCATGFILFAMTAMQMAAGLSGDYDSAVGKFLGSQAITNFGKCNLILLNDGNSEYWSILEALTERVIHSTPIYSVKFNSETRNKLFANIHPYGQHTYFTRFGPVAKLRPSCSLAFSFLRTVNDAVTNMLFHFLTPKHWEVMKKDEDHFIFITKASLVKPLLLSGNFGAKIKFKIAISFDLNKQDFEVFTVCFFCNHGQPVLIELFNFKVTEAEKLGVTISKDQLFPDLVQKFNGFELVAANSVRTFQRTEMVLENGKYEPVRGLYFIILFSVMKPHFNFTVRLIPSFGDGGTGLRLKNGTWFGSVGDILLDRAHIGMVSGQNVYRNQVVGFAFSLAYEWITFATRKPKGIFTWEAVYRPFDSIMWSLVTAALIATITTLFLMSKFLSDSYWNLKNVVNYIIGSILDQSCKSPLRISARLLCGCWLMFALIVSTAYRSQLFGFLMFPEIEPIPQNFEQLANSKDYNWGLNYVAGAAYAIFATSQEATYKKIFAKLELVKDSHECYRKSATSNYGCISWQSFADYLSARNFTDKSGRSQLVVAPSFTFFIPCGWVLEKRAIFRTNFDRVLHMGHDSGLVLKWEQMDWDFVRKRRWSWERSAVNQSAKALQENDDGPTPLHIQNLIGGFYLLTICVVMCSISFAGELFMSFKMPKKTASRGQNSRAKRLWTRGTLAIWTLRCLAGSQLKETAV